MSILVVFVVSGFTYELVVTETNIYVLADVSYSSHENLDKIDEYIDNIDKAAPKNSKLGVIAFAKDYEILYDLGEKKKSVRESNVDASATNINEALSYAGSLFKENIIKRIVIISDGKETNKSNIVSVVEALQENDVLIDAIYLDNNIKEGTPELQISQIDYNESTFLNKEESVDVLIESSIPSEVRGVIKMSGNGNEVLKKCKLNKGLNVISIPLDTTKGGSFDYKVEIDLDSFKEGVDTSKYNNSMSFRQEVSSEVNVLFIGDTYKEEPTLNKLYKDTKYNGLYKVDEYLGHKDVPYTVEDLCKYDEICLSNVDIRELKHSDQFIESLELVVQEFGKRLITVGNTYIQKTDDRRLSRFAKMLPVSYGNNNSDEKVLALVLDISRSLQFEDKVNIAKKAACTILDLLNKNDMVAVIGFAGDVEYLQTITSADDINTIKDKINSIVLKQGTFLGTGLEAAYNTLKDLPYNKKEVILISDGLPYGPQKETAIEAANNLRKKNIPLSAINTNSPKGAAFLQQLVSAGLGNYYFCKSSNDIVDLVLTDVADDVKETVIEKGTYELKLHKNKLLDGITTLPSIHGYYFNEAKNHTKVLLSTSYTSRGGVEYDVPIYTKWSYGNGEVATLATNLSNSWASEWSSSGDSGMLLDRLAYDLIPEKKQDTAFIFDVEMGGSIANVKIKAPTVSVGADITLTATAPNKKVSNLAILYDGEYYTCELEIGDMGLYKLDLAYKIGNKEHKGSYSFVVSYSDEYDSFTSYEASSLYHMVTENGEVSEDGKLELKNDSSYVESYLYDFTILFMAITCVLFVTDICVRKLRLEDIKSLLKIKGR